MHTGHSFQFPYGTFILIIEERKSYEKELIITNHRRFIFALYHELFYKDIDRVSDQNLVFAVLISH